MIAKRLVTMSLLLVLLPVVGLGQQTSSVTGIVTDSVGAVINGATVTLTDTKTGREHATKTDEKGVYSFVRMAPGSGYTLTFGAQGFETLVVTGVSLGVGITETHNAEMSVGLVTEKVEVQSGGQATLNTTDATIGSVIDTRRLVDLPIQIRSSPAALMSLQPGVVGNNVGTTSGNRVGSVTGARADQGNITIDGIDANDGTTGQAFATVGNAPIDSVQEFRAISANPQATDGRSSGGQIQLVTKSGTNDFHGSLREFNRTAKTAANSFFNNRSGVARPQLTRNQFGGSIGGPIKKEKLFFFFDLEARRDAQGVTYTRIVPLNHVRNGGLAFVNSNDGCLATSRLNNAPGCITILSPSQVAALDPKGIGSSAALLSFVNGRYPAANDLTLGDGVNSGGFRFNAPSHRNDETYTTRIDYNFTDNQKFFGRFNIARRLQTDTINSVAQQFPGDPESAQISIRDYTFVVGHTWTINPYLVNQATFGVSRQGAIFLSPFAPAFPNVFTFGPLAAPFAGISTQDRFVPVPTIRDDVTWTRGSHNIQFGGSIKPIQSKTGLVNDFNFATYGLGGLTNSLDATLRPATIRTTGGSTTNTTQWDTAFAFYLGRLANLNTNFNYDTAGTAFAPGTGKKRNFHYNEYEFYGQDTWKVRNNLTMGYGLRWQYYSTPFEADGFQAGNDVDFNDLYNVRVKNAAAGISGPSAEPFLKYDLIGKANNARGYSKPDRNNFSPRLSLSYNPSFKDGVLGALFGDRKTVITAGGSVVYDRVGGAITFVQDQVSYLFDNSATRQFGAANPRTALLNDPRFISITNLGVSNTAPTITRPFTPFVQDGVGVGNATGEFNYAVDQNFVIPYSGVYTLGIQREMPKGFLLDVVYVGRQGRKLFTQADAAQVLDFKDAASGQFMLSAFNALQAQIRAGVPRAGLTAQPWFENQISSALGGPCQTTPGLGGLSCTQVVQAFFGTLVRNGDTSDTLQGLYGNALLDPNVGLSSQFSTNIYISNQGSSSYNGLLVSLRKRLEDGLQFDFNYTFSHSIDNQSSIVNTVAGGLVCDLRNLRVCRGNSDFDVRHLINANFIYELPFGRGKKLGDGAPGWVNQVIGGWEASGIYVWRTGLAFSTTTGQFPVGFNFNSPATLVGDSKLLRAQLHETPNGTGNAIIQFFSDPNKVAPFAAGSTFTALDFPKHGEIGNRNNLRGLGYWNMDMAILKNFKMPWSETQRLQFRWEMYNAFNHNVFGLPAANISLASFGQITTSASTPREMQFALRFDF